MISNPSSGDVNAHRRQGSARVHDSAGNKICSHNDQLLELNSIDWFYVHQTIYHVVCEQCK